MVIPVREVTVAQAKAQLSSLLDAVVAGEPVVITRRGKAIADLVPRRRFATSFRNWKHCTGNYLSKPLMRYS